MTISFRCSNPACRGAIRAPDAAAGQEARCPSCGETQTVPAREDASLAGLGKGPVIPQPPWNRWRRRLGPPCKRCGSPLIIGVPACEVCGWPVDTKAGRRSIRRICRNVLPALVVIALLLGGLILLYKVFFAAPR
ncbi:MAG TPA: hypothetical protein VM389_05420 [Phycisphaerae bacterium]|nr:hypothetical protein [Phycisphaerae bacterium]